MVKLSLEYLKFINCICIRRVTEGMILSFYFIIKYVVKCMNIMVNYRWAPPIVNDTDMQKIIIKWMIFFFCSKHNNLFLWIQTTVNRPFVLPRSACCFSELLSMLKPINSYFGKINNIKKTVNNTSKEFSVCRHPS